MEVVDIVIILGEIYFSLKDVVKYYLNILNKILFKYNPMLVLNENNFSSIYIELSVNCHFWPVSDITINISQKRVTMVRQCEFR